MSYEADLEQMARQLGHMVGDPAIAQPSDLHLVDNTRRALRHWCRQVLVDVASPVQFPPTRPTLTDLAARPVATLRALLAAEPHPYANIGQRTPDPTSTAADPIWRRLANDVELVNHGWQSADPASRPFGPAAWAAIADVAAVAEAAAIVDRTLAAQFGALTHDARIRDCWELSIAARHCREIALLEPVAQPSPLQTAPRLLRPVPVSTLADLPQALTTLNRLTERAYHVGADSIARLAGAHATTLDTLAATLVATSTPAMRVHRRSLADALREQGRLLNATRPHARNLRSIDSIDIRPGHQLVALRDALTPIAARPAAAAGKVEQAALLAAVRPAVSYAITLANAAHHQLRTGRWFGRTDQGWRPTTTAEPLTEALADAAQHARAMLDQLPRPRPRPTRRRPAELLDPHLRHLHAQPATRHSTLGPR